VWYGRKQIKLVIFVEVVPSLLWEKGKGSQPILLHPPHQLEKH
jgi:hypothetical protein